MNNITNSLSEIANFVNTVEVHKYRDYVIMLLVVDHTLTLTLIFEKGGNNHG